jgi:hypothetical protein
MPALDMEEPTVRQRSARTECVGGPLGRHQALREGRGWVRDDGGRWMASAGTGVCAQPRWAAENGCGDGTFAAPRVCEPDFETI